MRVRLAVSFDLPEGADRRDAVDYVADAVKTWRGQCRPPGSYSEDDDGDPMFGLDSDSVTVTTKTKRRIIRS